MGGSSSTSGQSSQAVCSGIYLTLQPGWGCHPQSLMIILTSPTMTQNKWCLKQSIIDLEYCAPEETLTEQGTCLGGTGMSKAMCSFL